MNTVKAERKIYFDNIKGILIVLVVFAHCLWDFQFFPMINLIVDTIYVFHMPAFIFISGYLSKSEHSRGRNALIKIMSSYFLFNTLMIFYQYCVNSMPLSLLTPYYSYWYLLALLVWRLIVKRISRIKGALIWSLLAALGVGFFSEFSNLLAISRIVSFFPFFLAGFLLPSKKLESFLQTRKVSHYIKGALLFAVSVLLAFFTAVLYSVPDSALLMFPYQNLSEFPIRILLFMIAALIILSLWLCLPDREIPGFTKIGRNTLSIFLLHRIPTMLLIDFLKNCPDWLILLASIGITALLCWIFGSNFAARLSEKCINFFAELFAGTSTHRYARIGKFSATILIIALLAVIPITFVWNRLNQETTIENATVIQENNTRIYPQMDSATQAAFSDDFKILFAGDLILLEDQVKRAYNGKTYDFFDVFEYAKPYISSADLAIGVFEGPVAGEEAGYSTSNYDDGKTLALNYPDEFAYAIKEAGFDLVTTANNHLLDKGLPGALRTLDILDEAGLEHVGSYRNKEEKDQVKIIECDGIKIAILAYTYGSNGYTETQLLNGELSYLTSLTAVPNGANFEAVKASVEADFAKAKVQNPDLILVLPHMGTQFLDSPDAYQETWNDIFISYGADLILNDHTHSVQPVEIFEYDGKTRAIINCPGNFANIYREYHGDASAMVEIYIDKTHKTITGAAVIPMWTQAPLAGNYRALPIYDILNNPTLQNQISTYDLERIEEVQKHITKIMLGTELDCEVAQERYYLTSDGFLASKASAVTLSKKAENSALYQKLVSSDIVCFVGDSVTEGTTNGGYGWYRPLESLIPFATQYAQGGGTTKTVLPDVPTNASLYVVALGTNDVRYRDENICAMTSTDYIAELNSFVERIRTENPEAEFAFISPWMALENDPYSAISPIQRDILLAEYGDALKQWCEENGHIYSNPNSQINDLLSKEIHSDYLLDHIHPNRSKGIELYSIAVLENS